MERFNVDRSRLERMEYLSGATVLLNEFNRVPTLEQDQLDRACGDGDTVLDGGMSIPLCSEVEWYEKVHGER